MLAGIAGVVSFVVGAALTAQASAGAPRVWSALALAIYFSGAGLGIVASSLAVPPPMGTDVAHTWRSALLGTVGATAAATHVNPLRMSHRSTSAPRC
jgi:hypothetical protein